MPFANSLLPHLLTSFLSGVNDPPPGTDEIVAMTKIVTFLEEGFKLPNGDRMVCILLSRNRTVLSRWLLSLHYDVTRDVITCEWDEVFQGMIEYPSYTNTNPSIGNMSHYRCLTALCWTRHPRDIH